LRKVGIPHYFEVPEFSGLENMLLSESMILALNGITGSETRAELAKAAVG